MLGKTFGIFRLFLLPAWPRTTLYSQPVPRHFAITTQGLRYSLIPLLAAFIGAFIAGCSGGGGGGGSAAPVSMTISGRVSSAASGGAIANVTVSLTGTAAATRTTDAAGQYSFTNLASGTYTVTPSLADAVFDPDSRTVTLNGAGVSAVDFQAIRGSIVALGVNFLPDTFNSNNRLRASLLVRGGSVLFTDSSDFPLKKTTLDGSLTTPLASRFDRAESLVLRGDNIYWVDGGRLNKTSLAGTTTVLARGERSAGAGVTADIVVDETDVYWVNTVSSLACSPPCSWVIQRVPLAGGPAVTVASASHRVVALTGNADHLYWEEASLEPVSPGCLCGSAIKSVAKAGGLPALLVDGLLNLPPPPLAPGMIPGSWLPTGGLALTATEVVFAEAGNAAYRLNAVPLAGGTVRTLASVSSSAGWALNSIRQLNIAGTNVYWLDSGNRALNSVALAGGSVTVVAGGLGLPADLNQPIGLAIEGGSAFWTEPVTVSGCCVRLGIGSIRQVALTGGVISTVADGVDAPGAIAVDAANLVWSEVWRVATAGRSGGPTSTLASGISGNLVRISANASTVYLLDGSLIKTIPIAGGKVEKLASAHLGAVADLSLISQDIATDGTNVYWTVLPIMGAPIVQKVAVSGGTPVTLANEAIVANPQDCEWRIAVDAESVYWSSGSATSPVGCAVKKVAIGGGAVTTLVDLPYLVDFTIDATNVYFSELGSNPGAVQKVPINGGAASTVATNVVAWVLSNDANHLYWLDPRPNFASIAWISKAVGTPTSAAIGIPILLSMDPFIATDALVADPSGLYFTETQTGSIYSMF